MKNALNNTQDVDTGTMLDEPHALPPLCLVCPDEPLPAMFRCNNCGSLPLCLVCKGKHEGRTKGHDIVTVEQPKDTINVGPHKRIQISKEIKNATGFLESA